MNNMIKNMIKATSSNAQYDAYAKQLLSNKIILAHILKGTVEEFSDMDPEAILPLIEGEPYISEIPVEPGETNRVMTYSGNKITGNNTEDVQLDEGKIYFDIIFYVRMRDGISRMIINIESQKSAAPGYPIKHRAIYYTSRMLSSQKERDFVNSDYNGILKTYSIWICFNMNENCLNHLHMIDTPLLGNHIWDGETNLLNVVLVGLSKHLTKTAIYETESNLHYFLGTLFSDQLNAAEKITLLNQRFQIEKEDKIRKELNEMCNLSYMILEKGIEQGIEQGICEKRKKVVREMLLDHQPYALIKKYTDASDEEIKQMEDCLFVK